MPDGPMVVSMPGREWRQGQGDPLPSVFVDRVEIAEGPKGDDGEPGPQGPSSEAPTYVADVVLSGHRIVKPVGAGRVTYVSNSEDEAAGPIMLTLNAAASGDPVQCIVTGEVTEPSWNWSIGSPLYLGDMGTLTEVPPGAVPGHYIRQVGRAVTQTTIYFDPSTAVRLA